MSTRPLKPEISPIKCLVTVIVAILIAQTLVMALIHLFFLEQPLLVETIIDGVLLVIILFPFLYLFLLNPLLQTITEQKLTEQQLRASQQEWEDTFNTISSVITVHDAEFNIIKANRAAEIFLDLPAQGGTGIKCHACFHGSEVPPEGCPSCRALKLGVEVAAEFYEPHLNAYLEVRAIPKFDSNNRQAGLIQVARNITGRKQMELSLHESSQKLKILFQAAPVAIFVLDTEANVTMWNTAAEQIFGWTAEEVVGKPYPLVPPDAWKELSERFKKLLSGDTLSGAELKRLRKDGSLVDVSLFLSPLRNAQDEVCAAIGVAMDISSRKQAQDALVETKERYRCLVEYSPYGIAIHDGERFMFVNDAGSTMLGAETPETLIGMPVMDFIHPDEREAGKKCIEEVLSQGRIFSRFEMKVVRLDGEVADFEMAAIPFVFQNIAAVHLIATDVSDRKLAEEKLRVSLLEKEVLVKELHHRVKNNLQVIYALLGLQSRYLRDERDVAIFIESQNRVRTLALINEELFLSENLTQIDFAACIRRLSAHLYDSYGSEPISIEHHIAAGDMFDIDMAVPCGLIINELVCNSLKYAFPDRTNTAGKVCIDLDKEADRYILRVSDNGVGLPAGLDFSNATSLGFRLVKILANQICASIDITTEKGTQFIISFNCTGSRSGT